MIAIEMFALGVGFYLLLGALSIILTILLETEHPRFSGICLIALFWYLRWTKTFDVLDYAKSHPAALIGWVAIYFAVGAASLWPKWFGFVSDELEGQADRFRKLKPGDYRIEIGKLEAPIPGDHKEQLISWAVYWPWSMFWFIVRHPLRRIGRLIYDSMEASLTKMSDSMTARAKERLEKAHGNAGRQGGVPR